MTDGNGATWKMVGLALGLLGIATAAGGIAGREQAQDELDKIRAEVTNEMDRQLLANAEIRVELVRRIEDRIDELDMQLDRLERVIYRNPQVDGDRR